jgi:hypothetical protein
MERKSAREGCKERHQYSPAPGVTGNSSVTHGLTCQSTKTASAEHKRTWREMLWEAGHSNSQKGQQSNDLLIREDYATIENLRSSQHPRNIELQKEIRTF